MVTYHITLPSGQNPLTVKELLEEHWLIPRKIRHFLRTKKHLLVNDQQVTWQTSVQTNDKVSLTFDDEDYPKKAIPFGDKTLVDCLYEDEHLIIVNKPEGMKTHGNEPTELALLNHVSAYVGATCYVVHRLDMETSGVILFAKNPFVLPIVNRLLECKKISRHYWALAEGHFGQKQVTYRNKIGRDRHDRRKRVIDAKHGQRAVTHITNLKAFKEVSLVNCQLETGRTHQIRVHLSHHNHPILGDPLYSKKAAPRLMLHAHQLQFTHPFTRQKITVKATSESFERELHKLTEH